LNKNLRTGTTSSKPWIYALTCILALLFSFVPRSIQAQVSSGDVIGTVTDSTGAVIIDAKVTIKNVATAATRTTTTNAKGVYV